MQEKIFTFNGGYNREGVIKFTLINCQICNGIKIPGLFIDASEDEYNAGCICFNCIDKNK